MLQQFNLSLLFINSLFIFGLQYATQFEAELYIETGYEPAKWRLNKEQSKVLGFIHFYLRKGISEHWMQPLLSCPVCMASVWGSVFYLSFTPFSIEKFAIWPVYVVALAGLNRLLKGFA
jgi:hypothetical protein